ncbi:alcohol o-acetyltransferase 1 [Fusarium mundagurra]|uniref:Alcohol o-acetyltransferase 1 n=1 Tax=Fusarium mundagurra TaxID=1567541 RepID=A0A8H6DBW8_9HYPO|nr:alcohol o-acetyltransferase 1 [Fusarium mundagurra]
MDSNTNDFINIVRDCGPSECMLTAWHELGLYFRTSNTATLKIPRAKRTNVSVTHLIRTAVAQVMLKQPVMRVGIIGETKKRPQFIALSSIDLSEQVEDDQASSLDDVARNLEKLLLQPWSELSRRPGWHVRIFHEPESSGGEFYRVRVCLTVHHAICDGISTAMFQSSLVEALNNPDANVALMVHKSLLVKLTDDLSDFPPSQHQLFKFTADISWVLSKIWDYSVPSILKPLSLKRWSGKPCDPNIKAARLRYLVVDSTFTNVIVDKCRENGTTLTNLLNALCVVSFARRVKTTTRQGFESSTSISLRPYIPEEASFDKCHMSLCVTGYNQEFGPDILAKAQTGVDSDIWELAARLREDLKRKMDMLPHNDFSFLSPYISDWYGFTQARYGKPRRELWGLSNLGLITAPSKGLWELESVMFAQFFPVVSAALTVSVASVDRGDMVISFMWQDGILETGLIEDVRDDLDRWLTELGEEGSLGV